MVWDLIKMAKPLILMGTPQQLRWLDNIIDNTFNSIFLRGHGAEKVATTK